MQTGWLSPSGEFFPCEVFDHIALAEDFVEKFGIASQGQTSADDILLSTGWVKITRSLIHMKEQNVFWDHHLTESQKRFLRPYFEENDEPMSSVAKMRWEYEMDRE